MPTKRGKKWQVNIRVNGKLLRPTFDNEIEAKTWELRAKDARDKGLPLPPFDSKATSTAFLGNFIADVFEELWGSNKSRSNYLAYTSELINFFGKDMKLSDINTYEVDRFLKACSERGNSDKTLNRKISVLSKLLKKAHEREEIAKLPAMKRRREGRGRTRFMTDYEADAIVDTLWKIGHEQASKRCLFMIYTGARDGEVRNLQWSDINGRKVTLDGKTGHRTIVMPQKAVEALQWCREQGYTKPFPMAYETFKEAWDAGSAAIGKLDEPGWVPYIMRHTAASRLVQRGVDLRRVKDYMGHSAIQTTMNYAHLSPNDLEVCAEALDS